MIFSKKKKDIYYSILLFFTFSFYLFLAIITNKMLFTCFFGEPMLTYDIVTVCLFLFFIFNGRFWCFFICFVIIKYALCVGCYLILITDVRLVS